MLSTISEADSSCAAIPAAIAARHTTLAALLVLQMLFLPGCILPRRDQAPPAKNHTPLTDLGATLSVSPAGDAVSLTWFAGTGVLIHTLDGKVSALPGEWGSRCEWAPDGRKFTAVQHEMIDGQITRRIVWVDSHTLSLHAVTQWSHRLPATTIYSYPQWSADGQWILFQALEAKGITLLDPYSILATNLKGMDKRLVVGSLLGIEKCCQENQLLIRGARVNSRIPLYAINLTTGIRQELLPGQEVKTASLNPRGDLVAALCRESANSGKSLSAFRAKLIVAKISGIGQSVLTEGLFAPRIFWSPDGSKIALSRLSSSTCQPSSADDWRPVILELTREHAHLPDIGSGRDLQWSNDGTMFWITRQGVIAQDRHGNRRFIVYFPIRLPA